MSTERAAGAHLPRRISFVVSGSANIRGTHRKTLEFKREPGLTLRETCVVGSAATGAWPERMLLSGPLRISIRVADAEEVVLGLANPAWSDPARLVIRRSATLLADTAVFLADKAAADLRRDVIGALAAGAEATVVIEESGSNAALNAALWVVRSRPDAESPVLNASGPRSHVAAAEFSTALEGSSVRIFTGDEYPDAASVPRLDAEPDSDSEGLRLEAQTLPLLLEELTGGEWILLFLDANHSANAPEVAQLKNAALKLGAQVRLIGTEWSVAEIAFFRSPSATGVPSVELDLTANPARAARLLRASWVFGEASAMRLWTRRLLPTLEHLIHLGFSDRLSVGMLPPDDRSWTGRAGELRDTLKVEVLGSTTCVLYLPARETTEESLATASDESLRSLLASTSIRDLSIRLANETGQSRRASYQRLLAIKDGNVDGADPDDRATDRVV